MQKKKDSKNKIQLILNTQERETEILNIICNTTIFFMTIMTKTFTSIFTKISKKMMTAITTGLDVTADTTKKIHGETTNIQNEFST